MTDPQDYQHSSVMVDSTSPGTLTAGMSEVPAYLCYWVGQLELRDAELSRLEAAAFERETEAGTKGDKLPAIERVKVRVALDPSVQACLLARAHAKAMVEGLRAKRDMLVSIAALMREEMRQDLRVNE